MTQKGISRPGQKRSECWEDEKRISEGARSQFTHAAFRRFVSATFHAGPLVPMPRKPRETEREGRRFPFQPGQ